MAIDTKEKRASVIGVGRPYLRDKFPVAVPDEEWRASSANSYGGNALSPPAVSDGPRDLFYGIFGNGLIIGP